MGATNTGCAQETVAVIHHTFCKIFMHEICKHFPLREYRTQGSVNKRLLFLFSESFSGLKCSCCPFAFLNPGATYLAVHLSVSLVAPETPLLTTCVVFCCVHKTVFLLTYWNLYQLSSPALWWAAKWAITKIQSLGCGLKFSKAFVVLINEEVFIRIYFKIWVHGYLWWVCV